MMKETTTFEIRPYGPGDTLPVLDMLVAEGVGRGDTGLFNGVTYVAEEEGEVRGFFTLGMRHNKPYLHHLCISRKFRKKNQHQYAWALIAKAREIVRTNGFGQMIVHGKGQRLIRFLWAYWRTAPYDQADDGTAFFLVGV